MKRVEETTEKIKFTCRHCRCKFTSDEYKFEHHDAHRGSFAYNMYTDTCPKCKKETWERKLGF